MANLILDEAGMPVPQYYDSASNTFMQSTGEQGALNMNMQVFLKTLMAMTEASVDTTDAVADVTTFNTVGDAKYTTAQIYIEASNNIIAASIVAPVTVGGTLINAVLIRKAPSSNVPTKSLTIMLDPKVNAALPSTWFIRVATERDVATPRTVNVAYQFIR